MERPTFLMHEGTSDGRITKGDICEHTFLSEPAGTQKESVNIATVEEKRLSKVVLIVDDDPDMTSVFGLGLQDEGFEVYTFNDPLVALSQFRPNFYDLLLVDINMPKMNGIDLSRRLLESDSNVKICFITAGEANIEVLRELYPTRGIGCFIKKPVTMDQLVRRVKAELE
ncbi:MAG TPA: response regulator [Nitrososphaeraceae archaeon]|nr:response regulator [Nitrososphaeraceae archaeon]